MPANIRFRRVRQLAEISAGFVRSTSPTSLLPPSVKWGRGQISAPIPVPGGVSILAVQDARKILSADPRNAVLSLKQVSITFPQGTTWPQAEPWLQNSRKRPGTSAVAAERTVSPRSSTAKSCRVSRFPLRQLPSALQEMMLPMQVGQATRPFGSIEEGVRTLVICGRDEADPDRADVRSGDEPDERKSA